MKIFRLALLFSIFSLTLYAQKYTFTHDDTLRGSITKERAWWDLQFYHLNTRINPADSTIGGSVTVRYKVIQPSQVLQIDLQRPLTISKITQDGQELTYKRDGDAFFCPVGKTPKTQCPRRNHGVLWWPTSHCKTCAVGWWFFLETRPKRTAFCRDLMPRLGSECVVALQRPHVRRARQHENQYYGAARSDGCFQRTFK